MSDAQCASFYLGDGLFGLDNRCIREINKSTEFTHVDLAPAFVRGLLNLRGQIVTVVDLRIRLGLPVAELTGHSRCIVLKKADELREIHDAPQWRDIEMGDSVVGLLVDRIGDMVTAPSGLIESPPANMNEIDTRLVEGVVKLNDGLMAILKLCEVIRKQVA